MDNNYLQRIDCGKVTVIENAEHQWGVVDRAGNLIVPFGKYAWIDGFDSGLARVRTEGKRGLVKTKDKTFLRFVFDDNGKMTDVESGEKLKEYYSKDRKENPEKYAWWGIINEKGEEVLPLEYEEIWNFYGKNRTDTRAVKDGKTTIIQFHDLNPDLPIPYFDWRHDDSDYDEEYGRHYGEFAGTYAQDVAGLSDDVINDAFEGDPDAYWNID